MTLCYGMVTLCSILTVGLTDRNELVPTADCICPKQNFTYECSVVGEILTIWNISGCEITLRHNQYLRGENGSCNDGAAFGQSIEVVNNSTYRSNLTIFVNDSDGQTITCSAEGQLMNITTINSTTLLITREPFPPPTNIQLVQASPTKLVFNWTAPMMKCPSLKFTVYSQNCGTCQNKSSSLNTTCRNFTLSTVCLLRITSIICGDIRSNTSSNITVNLTEPTISSKSVKIIPCYSKGDNTLLRLVTNFNSNAVEPINISDEIDSSVTYKIYYTDHNSGTICRSVTIPATECRGGVCSDVFEVSSSPCCFMTNINVTLLANYILGEVVIFEETKDGINKFVDVTFIPSSRSIKCKYKSSRTDKICSANIYQGPSCNISVASSHSVSGTGNELVIPSVSFMDDVAEYCIEITASSDGEMVVLKGTLNVINTGNQLQLGLVLSLSLVIIVLFCCCMSLVI